MRVTLLLLKCFIYFFTFNQIILEGKWFLDHLTLRIGIMAAKKSALPQILKYFKN